jgi:hypothetical protein
MREDMQDSNSPLCQSCAMPLVEIEHFGTNCDGSQNQEYCCHCYQQGSFTNPDLSLVEMINKVVTIMQNMGMSPELITQVQTVLPQLKRWQVKS